MKSWIGVCVATIVIGTAATVSAQSGCYSPEHGAYYGRPAMQPIRVHYAQVVGPTRSYSPSTNRVNYPPYSAQYAGNCNNPCACGPAGGAANYAPSLVPSSYNPVRVNYRGAYLSSGIYGQPTVFKPGQPLRNFWRYLTP